MKLLVFFLELVRRLIAQRLMDPLAVVKHFDVFDDRKFGFCTSRVNAVRINPLALQFAEPTLTRSVIQAIAFAAHALTNRRKLQRIAKWFRGKTNFLQTSVEKLHAAITVKPNIAEQFSTTPQRQYRGEGLGISNECHLALKNCVPVTIKALAS